LNRSDKEALEVFYLALLLGFRGTSRDNPADVQDWREQFEGQLGIHESLKWGDAPPALPMPPTHVPPLTAKARLRTFLVVLATLGMGMIGGLTFLIAKSGVS
ncbi:MAG: DotU family type IV/VI secretion system protein, partial [Gemmataceae bacterium]